MTKGWQNQFDLLHNPFLLLCNEALAIIRQAVFLSGDVGGIWRAEQLMLGG